MTPYEIWDAACKIIQTPMPMKESLRIISARLKDGYDPWQILGYMDWLTKQSWFKGVPSFKYCKKENLAKWVNDGEPLPHGSLVARFKFKEEKKPKVLGKEFRLHASDLEMYLRCPKQLWWKLTKGPMPPAAAAFRGTCFHRTLHHNFGQKIETKKDIPLDDAKGIFGATWDEGWKEAEFKEDEDPGKMKDEGYSMVDIYWGKMAPAILPLGSEISFEIDLGAIPVAGIIDRITEKRVLDDKTAGRMWRDGSKKLQPFIYPLARYKETKTLFPFSFIVTTPKATEEVPVEVSVFDFYWFITDFLPKVYNDIQAGRFTPDPTGWWCSEKWCGWWPFCRGKEEPRAVAMLRRRL